MDSEIAATALMSHLIQIVLDLSVFYSNILISGESLLTVLRALIMCKRFQMFSPPFVLEVVYINLRNFVKYKNVCKNKIIMHNSTTQMPSNLNFGTFPSGLETQYFHFYFLYS